ncbi:MAG: DegV family protein [Dehalococcoidia bacterium]
MTVRIVTDSTADLLPETAAELGVSVVPLSVIFGEETLREGIDISTDLFYEKLVRSKDLPTTSAPSVGEFIAAYEEVLKETDEIVSIHLSSKLSVTHNNAVQAARHLSDSGARIEVIDSGLVSLGIGFLVRAASRAAAGGATVEEIKQLLDDMMPRINILIVLDTLEYVRRGGRIGRARAFLGSVLKVKPLLSIREGELAPGERIRTKKRALERLFQIATSYPNVIEFGIAYSTNAHDAEELRQRLASAVPGTRIEIARLGPVIGVHGGPGVLGLGVLQGE